MNYTLHIKMRYSIEPRGRISVRGYGFLSFTKIMGTFATNVAKHLRINTVRNLSIQLKNLRQMQ